jgi:hypothetical protein
VRQLVEVDHGFGGAASSYQRVYVIDGAVPHAGDPMRPQSRLPAKPFDPHTKAQIARQLDDLPPLAFVSHPDQVIARRNANPLGHVIHQGVLVSLGRVKWIDDHTAQVPNNRWQTGLSGQWLTYIVKLRHGTWHVAGVLNGTMAIS